MPPKCGTEEIMKAILSRVPFRYLLVLLAPIVVPMGILGHILFGSPYETVKDVFFGYFVDMCGFKSK